MDMSVCDESMVTGTPAPCPNEDVLSSEDDDLYDVTEYSAEIYKYLRDAEVILSLFFNNVSNLIKVTLNGHLKK